MAEDDRNHNAADAPADASADADQLMPLVYDELRALAARHLDRERADHTLQPTALVHEVYLRLAGDSSSAWTDRTHFLAIAARCVRQVLISHARGKRSAKRGGGNLRLSLHDDIFDYGGAAGGDPDILDLEDAMEELARLDERQARVVELRYYGGLTVPEVAQILDVSARTVDSEWAVARAWLAERLLPSR